MIVINRALYLITTTKSEVWAICHCLGLGHETMISAVFLCSYNDVMMCKHFPHQPPFVQKIHQLSVELAVSGALGFSLLSSGRSTWKTNKQTNIQKTAISPVIWDVMVLMKRHCVVIGIVSYTDDICRYKGYLTWMSKSSVWYITTIYPSITVPSHERYHV